jgi:hypothetical protein
VGGIPEWQALVRHVVVVGAMTMGHLSLGGGVSPTCRGLLVDPPTKDLLDIGAL